MMNIVTENGVQYAEVNCRSVAEVVGLTPKGSSKPLRFPVVGYEKDRAGNMVPCLGVKMMSDEKYKELAMKKRAQRIFEIMDEQGVDRDVAEQLFLDELEEVYPDSDKDARETLYELDNET